MLLILSPYYSYDQLTLHCNTVEVTSLECSTLGILSYISQICRLGSFLSLRQKAMVLNTVRYFKLTFCNSKINGYCCTSVAPMHIFGNLTCRGWRWALRKWGILLTLPTINIVRRTLHMGLAALSPLGIRPNSSRFIVCVDCIVVFLYRSRKSPEVTFDLYRMSLPQTTPCTLNVPRKSPRTTSCYSSTGYFI